MGSCGLTFTGDYRRASIVHDQACWDTSGDLAKRRAADHMFFHACLARSCTIEEATTLYLGVRIVLWVTSLCEVTA